MLNFGLILSICCFEKEGEKNASIIYEAGFKVQRMTFFPYPTDWTKEDVLGLLDCMRSIVPSNDVLKFKTTESHMDWNKVTFAHYTGEMCKRKWSEISHEVRVNVYLLHLKMFGLTQQNYCTPLFLKHKWWFQQTAPFLDQVICQIALDSFINLFVQVGSCLNKAKKKNS